MSSFRRKIPTADGFSANTAAPSSSSSVRSSAVSSGALHAPTSSSLRGTKPFLNGQSLVSSGLSQLDAILGGGLLLRSMTLLEASSSSSSMAFVDDLLRYCVAEGVAAGQQTIVVTDDAEAFITFQLPLELSLAQKQVKQQLNQLHLKQDDDDDKLKIAWQYEKYLQPSESTKSSRFCHSFDLSKRMHPELLAANPPKTIDINDSYAQLLKSIQHQVKSIRSQSNQVIRLVIRDIGFPQIFTEESDQALILFLRRLRAFVRSQSAIICVLSRSAASSSSVEKEVQHMVDYVMECKSFVGEQDMLPAELSEFNGLFQLKKLARLHSLACHATDAMKFGIKRERRKLKIEKLHLPPEGSRSTAKTTSHTGCGSTSSNSSHPLAF